MPAHKHAELMAQYAQDAMETDKPWERWEFSFKSGWIKCDESPGWHSEHEYRRKPRTININGFEVPEPERKALECGVTYWIPCIDLDNVISDRWDNDIVDARSLSRGLVHLTREAAEIHAKALFSFTEENLQK